MIRGTGFGSMDKEKLREIASRGGKSAWEKGKAYKFTSEAASLAGKKAAQARVKKQNEGN